MIRKCKQQNNQLPGLYQISCEDLLRCLTGSSCILSASCRQVAQDVLGLRLCSNFKPHSRYAFYGLSYCNLSMVSDLNHYCMTDHYVGRHACCCACCLKSLQGPLVTQWSYVFKWEAAHSEQRLRKHHVKAPCIVSCNAGDGWTFREQLTE